MSTTTFYEHGQVTADGLRLNSRSIDAVAIEATEPMGGPSGSIGWTVNAIMDYLGVDHLELDREEIVCPRCDGSGEGTYTADSRVGPLPSVCVKTVNTWPQVSI